MPEIIFKIKKNFFSYAQEIKNSRKLTPPEKLILFTLYSYQNSQSTADFTQTLVSDTSLNIPEVKKSLYCLSKRGWLQSKNKNIIIKIPQKINKGQKIAQTWSKIFGTLQLTPYSFEKITAFIDDGLEEEVILDVLKESSEYAKGNPLNYCLAVLSNLLEKDIYTLEDYYDYKIERGEKIGKQIPGRAKKGQKRMGKQTLAELYKKGYQ